MKQKIRFGGFLLSQSFLIFLENILHTAIVSEFAVHAQVAKLAKDLSRTRVRPHFTA